MKRYNRVAVWEVLGAVVIAADCSIVEGAGGAGQVNMALSGDGEGVRVASWGAASF